MATDKEFVAQSYRMSNMSVKTAYLRKNLCEYFASKKDIAVAVSGGIDSLTLMAFANEVLGHKAIAMHAYSPAVPREATQRVKSISEKFNWNLQIFDAGEFADVKYLQNPVDRCYFCKSSLYFSISAILQANKSLVVSGANLDDLDDYRPGLMAAKEHEIHHPFIELGIDKQMVRSLSALVGLSELSSLPASPCLSSRVRTWIYIEPELLSLVDDVEGAIKAKLHPETLRFRIEHNEYKLELDNETLGSLSDDHKEEIMSTIKTMVARHGFADKNISWHSYKQGSSFSKGQVND